MSQVKLEHLYKRFGNVTAVGDFNLDVKDGEFISFLGLRAVARRRPYG